LFTDVQRSKVLSPILGHRCYLQSEIQEMLASAIGRQFGSRPRDEILW